jgi:predicted lipid-binding transport protein (Tim44 family)
MKMTPFLVAASLALALIATDADAARRFGGGGNLGKQRAVPTQNQAAPASTSPSSTTTPSQAAKPAPAATPPVTPAPKPSFMSRWGGLLAGLGIGALLASLFGAQMGPIVGLLLAVLVIGMVAMLVMRLIMRRRAPEEPREPAFAGIGSAVPAPPVEASGAPLQADDVAPAPHTTITIPGFEVEPFVRVAKTSFIRLQAANDAGDLDDIRDFTTPEMYAEIAMQIGERKGSQRIEVVSVDAKVLEAVIEDDYEVASVRFWGLIREEPGANPESFDEIWVVRKKANDRKAPWLIAGIQQAA